MTVRSIILFMARAVDFAVPLGRCSVLSISDEFFPTIPLSVLRNSASSRFRFNHEWTRIDTNVLRGQEKKTTDDTDLTDGRNEQLEWTKLHP